MKKLLYSFCGLLLATANIHATALFSDSFAYPNGNLVGQGSWLQNGASATTPIQVISEKAMVGSSGQDVFAALSSSFSLVAGTTFYIGTTIDVSAAQLTGDYFLNWTPIVGSTINSSRLQAKSATGGFQLGYVEGAGTGASPTWGTTTLNLNQAYRVVIAYNVVAGTLNDTANVYVDPTDYAVEGNNTVYLSDTWGLTLSEPTTLGTINLRQGSAANAPTLSVDNLVVGTSLADMQVVPEPSSAALVGLGLLAWGFIRRRN